MTEPSKEVLADLAKWKVSARQLQILLQVDNLETRPEFAVKLEMEGTITGFHDQTRMVKLEDGRTSLKLNLRGCSFEPLPGSDFPPTERGWKIQFPGGGETVCVVMLSAKR
jgi:hypothetical protein